MTPHGTASGYNWHKCRCDVCKAFKRASDRSYYERNREQIKARTNLHYHANAGQISEYRKAKDASRSDQEREADRLSHIEYRDRPGVRDRLRANVTKYAKTEKGRAVSLASAHKRRGTPLTSLAREYIEIIKHDPCVYCGAPMRDIDHIEPVAAGGSGDWVNLAPSCRSCNGRKHTFELLPFLLRRTA